MLWTPKRSDVALLSSTLTFTTLMRPAKSLLSCWRMGAIWRHGPHHGPQVEHDQEFGVDDLGEVRIRSIDQPGQ